MSANAKADSRPKITNSITIDFVIVPPRRTARPLAGCGKSLNRDDSPPQGLKPSLVLHDLRGAKAPLYHSAAGFRDFFRSLLGYCPKSGREPGAPKPGEAMAPTPISPIPSLQCSRPPFVYRSG